MGHLYFLAIVLGFPLVLLLLALVGGYLYRGRDAELLDWKPTRSPEREAELSINDVDQMRASLENLRHQRRARETLLR
jgi:hypothetical protein